MKENGKTQEEKVNLRKLKRVDLLELLIKESKENEALRARVKELEEKLKDREICIEKAGNIAQAALELNHIFEDAQAAADQYLESLHRIHERPDDVQSSSPEKEEI